MTPFVSHLRGRAGARGSTPRQSRRFYLPEDVAALITGGAFIPHRAAREPGLGWRAWSRVTGLAPTSGPAPYSHEGALLRRRRNSQAARSRGGHAGVGMGLAGEQFRSGGGQAWIDNSRNLLLVLGNWRSVACRPEDQPQGAARR